MAARIEEEKAKRAKKEEEKKDIAWGIRSGATSQPYCLVKDHRTP